MKITDLRKHNSRLGEESIINLLKKLPKDQKEKILAQIPPEQAYAILYNSNIWLRPKQILPPGAWRNWLILAGRGWGKGFAGAHAVIHWAATHDNIRIALVGPTAAEVRDVMVNGPSGILAWAPPHLNFRYNPSNRIITTNKGTTIHTFSAEEPEQLRGPQFHKAWVDELAKMRYQQDVWDMLSFCMRLGNRPQVVITTTPRPTPLIKYLVRDNYDNGGGTKTTTGTTYENKENLSQSFITAITEKYEGTRLGQQEIHARILEDSPTALFKRAVVERNLFDTLEYDNEDNQWYANGKVLTEIVVAIDPAGSTRKNSDDTGIVVVGKDEDEVCYILEDLTGKYTPHQWVALAVHQYTKYSCNSIVVERNYGGDMVKNAIDTQDDTIQIVEVVATKGKAIRAEPVSVLMEKDEVKLHRSLDFAIEELCGYDREMTTKSPNRMDAIVWGVYHLRHLDTKQKNITHAYAW